MGINDYEDLSDWEILCRFLPEGWKEKAKETGALQRARAIKDADVLLRILLIHLANGHSLLETAVRAREAGLAQLSDVAVMKRLKSSAEWLRWMAEQLKTERTNPLPNMHRRILAVDASTISEPGSTGTDWRIHYSLNLKDLRCDYFELTDRSGGETWRRFPVKPGDVLMGDRVYSTPVSVAHVIERGGDVLVRLNRKSLPLYTAKGSRFSALHVGKRLRIGEEGDWTSQVRTAKGDWIKGRLIALKLSREATRKALKRLHRNASRKQKKVSLESEQAAAYIFLWTSLGKECSAADVLELYRVRWQIELLFKRLKSIMGLGHLPKKDPQSARAWLYGKLLVALLVEQIIYAADALSPWGYRLDRSKEPLAGSGIRVS